MELDFIVQVNDDIVNMLTENSFTPKFTLPKKVYYRYFRPLLPLSLRHKIQNLVTYSKRHGDVCTVDEILVRIVLNQCGGSLESVADYYTDSFKSAILLTHDVETALGLEFVPEVISLEKRYGFKSSWNIVPHKYSVTDELVDYIRNEGNEIGIHGYNHDGHLFLSEKEFSKRVPYINDSLERYNAVGFRAPMMHRQLEWLQALKIEYDSSCFDYDAYQPFPGGCKSIWPFRAGRFIELPCTLLQDHAMFCLLKQKNAALWIDKARWVHEHYGVILALTHPDYLRVGDNLKIYEELLAFLSELSGSWRVLPRDLAAHFAAHWEGGTDERVTPSESNL